MTSTDWEERAKLECGRAEIAESRLTRLEKKYAKLKERRRFEAAAQFMAVIINKPVEFVAPPTREFMADMAIVYADALLARLDAPAAVGGG